MKKNFQPLYLCVYILCFIDTFFPSEMKLKNSTSFSFQTKGSPHFWGNKLYTPGTPLKKALSPAPMTFILAVYFSRGMEL